MRADPVFDTAVRTAYAMPAKADPLAFLLALNLTLAAKEKAGEENHFTPLPTSRKRTEWILHR